MDRIESSRPVARRLLPHAAALLILMAFVRLLVGPGVYTTDENAYLTQLDVLAAESSWLAPYPTDEILSQRSFAPLALSTETDDGWAAYSRHPLYVSLLRVGSFLSDSHGPVAISMLGVVLLAMSLGVVCHRMTDVDPRVGFWLVGVLSPYFVHGQVVWAHSLAGGLVGLAMWGLFASRRSRAGLVVAGLALAVAVALRTEAAFVVAGLTAGVALADGRLRDRALRASVVFAAGAAGFVIDRMAEAAVLGSESLSRSGSVAGEGFLLGRFQALTALLLSPGGESAGNLARLLCVVLLAAAVVMSKRSPTDDALIFLSGLAAAAGVAGALAGGSYVGLAPAAPLFVVGLVAANRNRVLRPLWVAAAVMSLGVVVTSPPDGGGLGWGGRYLLLSVPLIAPMVVAGLQQLTAEPKQRAIVAAAALAAVCVTLSGVRVLDINHENSEAVAAQTTDALLAFVDSDELLVGIDLRVGRVAPDTARSIPMLSTNDPAELETVVDLALDAGISEMVLVDLFDSPDVEVPMGWSVASEEFQKSVRFTRISFDTAEAGQ